MECQNTELLRLYLTIQAFEHILQQDSYYLHNCAALVWVLFLANFTSRYKNVC